MSFLSCSRCGHSGAHATVAPPDGDPKKCSGCKECYPPDGTPPAVGEPS